MNQELLNEIVAEVNSRLPGRFFGKLYQLSEYAFAIDFGLRGEFLFVSADPGSPRFYLVSRTHKQLDRQALPLSHFGQVLKAKLGGGSVSAISKDPDDRIVRFTFNVENEVSEVALRRLVVQLTGKAANLLLLDDADRITDALRMPRGAGQGLGEVYRAPPARSGEVAHREFARGDEASPSKAADDYYRQVDTERAFSVQAANVKAGLNKQLQRLEKLKANIQKDLEAHGDPEQHRRLGELLMANISTATRIGGRVTVTDYYAEHTPSLEVEIDENLSVQEAAASEFRRYSKARRAQEAIAERAGKLDREINELTKRLQELELIIVKHDAEALRLFDQKPTKPRSGGQKREAVPKTLSGVKQYVSSDGYEVWVGRAARDNDNLTFRLARPGDLWLHAGDYPGSHVIIRNPTRKEIPHRTIIEAAQLAARFSQASNDTKVIVHYTERKFLSKPKGAAPGLVRMSSFRSISVEPKEAISRKEMA